MSPLRPDPAAARIAATAAACRELGEIAAAVATCTACSGLVESRTAPVPGDFPQAPRFMVVGEAPGAAEDLAGHPFVGKAGTLLDALLAEAGVARHDIAVANVCNCRPPANRTPLTAEARRCAGWLDRQVELADPPLVVALGRTALNWALGAAVRLVDVRGMPRDWRGRRLLVSYHPSAAIRFGPKGAPRAALAADLRLAAALTAEPAGR